MDVFSAAVENAAELRAVAERPNEDALLRLLGSTVAKA
jgi:hypothetical protein